MHDTEASSVRSVYGVCAWFSDSSWANHSRQFFRAISAYLPVCIRAYDAPRGESSDLWLGDWQSTNYDEGFYPRICIGPMSRLVRLDGIDSIAYVVFESTYVPSRYIDALSRYKQVWVPSSWGREILISNGLSSTPIAVIPEGVDPSMFYPAPQVRTDRAYRFLAVGKWEPRKNLGALVRAFVREFLAVEPVELVLHCHNMYTNADVAEEIRKLLPEQHPRIVISPWCAWDDMPDLYRGCDAFVLPSRSEGWGLPIYEAMSSGLPVITTDYSAPREHIHKGVAYPISITGLVAINDSVSFHGDSGLWAEPDNYQLQSLMRHVYTNRDESRTCGIAARRHVLDELTWDHASRKALSALQEDTSAKA